jgi:curved DNA-binding protein CbpA
MDVIDLYEILQVDQHAEIDVIRAAYRTLARRYHPDFGGSTRQMASLNEAWSVLGDAARRVAYDARPEDLDNGADGSSAAWTAPPPASRATAGGQRMRSAAPGPAAQRPAPPSGTGTVVDFGRYAGWSLGALADQDPDYLEWLARTPIGRRLGAEIRDLLARRAAARASRSPAPPTKRRRAFS